MAKESSLSRWLMGARQEMGPDLHMGRVENRAAAGTPDVEGCYRGSLFWAELKSSKRPARPSTPIRLATRGREEQALWAISRTYAGGVAWYLIQVGHGHKRRLYMIDGCNVEELHAGATEARLQELDTLKMEKPKPSDVVLCLAGRPYLRGG